MDKEETNGHFPRYWVDPNSSWYLYWQAWLFGFNLVWVQMYMPIRMSFEDKRKITPFVAGTDFFCDLCHLVDMVLAFLTPALSGEGEFLFSRSRSVTRYLFTWFPLDCIALMPVGLFKALPNQPSSDDLHNFLVFNYAYIPRFYVMFLGFKLIRIRKAKQTLVKLARRWGMGVDKRKLMVTVWTLLLILHLIACFWGTAASFNLDSNQNWIFQAGIQDESIVYKYVTCLYWAAYTTITVGYGDILPRNFFETALTCLIFVIGVALFSYSLSTLANQFANLN